MRVYCFWGFICDFLEFTPVNSPNFSPVHRMLKERESLRATFWERRESEDTHEKSIFLLFRQNIPLGELIQGKIV